MKDNIVKKLISLIAIFIGMTMQSIGQELPGLPDFYTAPPDWSHDGSRVASSAGSDVVVWNSSTQEVLFELKGHTDKITRIVWSPDDSMLATGSADLNVRIWSMADGSLVGMFTEEPEPFGALVWSPDGKHILRAGADEDPQLLIWNVDTGERVGTSSAGSANVIGFTPDSEYFYFLASNSVGLLDGESFEWLNYFVTPDENSTHLTTIDWNSDSSQFVTADLNGGVYVWDLASRTITLQFIGYQGSELADGNYEILPLAWIRSVQFTPDDRSVQSISGDGTVRMWDLETEQLVAENVLSRNSAASWSRYGGQVVYQVVSPNRTKLGVPIAGKQIEVVVPLKSLEVVKSIARGCYKDAKPDAPVDRVLGEAIVDNLDNGKLPNFLDQVKKLKQGDIPEACRADVIAVAEAVIAEG
jgi:WD40 repeat protein